MNHLTLLFFAFHDSLVFGAVYRRANRASQGGAASAATAASSHRSNGRIIASGATLISVIRIIIVNRDAGTPSWNAKPKTFFFYLHKRGRDRVLCRVSADALEGAVQSGGLSETALRQIFDAHRLLTELRAAQKLNAGLIELDRIVFVRAEDI